jgi:hypothetical protein
MESTKRLLNNFITICIVITASNSSAHAVDSDISEAVISSVTTVNINEITSEIATYCPNYKERASARAKKLIKMGFSPYETYKDFEDMVQFVGIDPPRLIGLIEQEGVQRKSQENVWLTGCMVSAGGTLTEVGIKDALNALGLASERSVQRKSTKEFYGFLGADGWQIPVAEGERFAVGGTTIKRDGYKFSTLMIVTVLNKTN